MQIGEKKRGEDRLGRIFSVLLEWNMDHVLAG